MATTSEAIYENGIFKPVSSVPENIKAYERGRIIIETEVDNDLESEFTEGERASDLGFAEFEETLKEKS